MERTPGKDVFAHETGGKIDPPDQSAAIYPLRAGVPTLHAGRVEKLLPLIGALKR